MSNTAFGVAQTSAGVGTTDTDMRHILAAQWDSTGVINGLSVTGTTSLYYSVAAGVAVCSKGLSDGKTLAYFGGGNTSTVAANSSGNPRIDSVYIYSNDANQGDPDNLVHIGVTQGTAAATPTAPSIPTYATLLAQMFMPAGATTTANVHRSASVGYAIPYGASLGRIGYDANTQTIDQNWDSTWYIQVATSVTVTTDRLVDVDFDARAGVDSGTDASSYYVKVQVDGVDVTDGLDEMPVFDVWVRNRITFPLSLQAGSHTISVHAKANTSKTRFTWRGVRQVSVYDRGVER